MFILVNNTDNVLASPDEFPTLGEALEYAEAFRQRYAEQGYYLTADGFRIDPKHIELEVLPAE
jgi:hypothetical protein